MLTCTNCGASVREGARFCTSCGTRLNDPIDQEATGSWTTATVSDANPAGSATDRPEPAASWSTDAPETDGTPDEAETGETLAATREGDMQPETEASTEPDTSRDEGFTWSWRASTDHPEEDDPADEPNQVDEESGIVIEEGESPDPAPDDSELADATEIEILEDDQPGDGQAPEDDVAPETSDSLLVVDETADGQDESETLAAWAGQWEGEEAGVDDPDRQPLVEAEADIGSEGTTDVSGEQHGDERQAAPDDDEDTVSKAERLIGELRSLIPTLARPMPAPATSVPDPTPLADELEGAARAAQFDDLRETLQAARERPRDVDTMLSLSGKVDRLLELLDDRDNLARTAESAATRLRPGTTPPEP
jgi:hypothetical protein